MSGLDSNTHPTALDLTWLRERIAHGWWKLNDDDSHTLVGEPPHFDLYWAVRALDRRFPVHPDLNPIFDRLARTVAELYPERVRTEIRTTYDARIVLFEFNDDTRTAQCDVLQVLAAAAEPAQPP
jgi:hypothetical protein